MQWTISTTVRMSSAFATTADNSLAFGAPSEIAKNALMRRPIVPRNRRSLLQANPEFKLR
jgi:hypothetical protein